MPNFQEFERVLAHAPDGATVTFTGRGVVSFSRPAYEALGKPEGLKFLYDEAERIAGFKPAAKSEPNAYSVRSNGRSTAAVSALTFCHHIGIEAGSPARRWPLRVEDGIGCVNLKQEPQIVTGNRGRPGKE